MGSVPPLECPKKNLLWGDCSLQTGGASSSLISAAVLLGVIVKIARASHQEMLPVGFSLVYAKRGWIEMCVPCFCTHTFPPLHLILFLNQTVL